jgi:hypothetical protein
VKRGKATLPKANFRRQAGLSGPNDTKGEPISTGKGIISNKINFFFQKLTGC